MAIKWSWAFGPESAVTLEEMGWDFEDNDANYNAPDSTLTYTYAGSPTRYSLAKDKYTFGQWCRIPTGCAAPEGWVAAPVYVSGSYTQGRSVIQVLGASTGKYISIYMKTAATDTFALYVDNTRS